MIITGIVFAQIWVVEMPSDDDVEGLYSSRETLFDY